MANRITNGDHNKGTGDVILAVNSKLMRTCLNAIISKYQFREGGDELIGPLPEIENAYS